MKKLCLLMTSAFLFGSIISCSTDSRTQHSLTTTSNPSEGGSIQPESGNFDEGEKVTLQATPAEGWVFSRWEQDLNNTANPINFTMDKDYNVVGMFERRLYPLTITIEGQGTVNETVVQPKTTEYPEGSVIEIEAVPSENWTFNRWEGDLSGIQNPAGITVNGPTTILAVFNTFATINTTPLESITDNSAETGGNITDDGGSSVTKRGVCWSSSQDPTTSDDCTSDGSGTGSFTSNLTNLSSDTRYYVRAYATNSAGTAYGNQREFTTKGKDTETEVVDVTNPETGRTWMDRNLGASRVATFSTDEQAFGDLYQWGRAADGHQNRNSPTTSILSSSDQPGHGSFIIGSSDWRRSLKLNLWQGLNGVNNPCPRGYRIPTRSEWKAERETWNSNNGAGGFASVLKLPQTGSRAYVDGSVLSSNDWEFYGYWSSTVATDFSENGEHIWNMAINFSDFYSLRATGQPVRCIKD